MTTKAHQFFRGLTQSRAALSAVSVGAAGVLLLLLNIYSARHYDRWDLSTTSRFSLSEASWGLLESLTEPVSVVVLLPSSEPLLVDVRQTLDAYQAASTKLDVRFIDPDRDQAELIALGKDEIATLGSDSAENSSVLGDAAVLVRSGKKRWYIRANQLSEVDEEGARRTTVEAALTGAIAQVQVRETKTLCFISGHGEKSATDVGPEGLRRFAERLEIGNLQSDTRALTGSDPARALKGCDLIALLGPKRPVPQQNVDALVKARSAGVGLLLGVDPIVDSKGELVDSGLGPLAETAGVTLTRSFILESASEARLPQGMGEAFLASAQPHPICRGLKTEQAPNGANAIVMAASALRHAPGSNAAALLQSSAEATALGSLGSLEPSKEDAAVQVVAYASPKTASGGRAVVLGTSNFFDNENYREAALYGNQLFAESALSWLSDRKALVSVPSRPTLPPGLALSEESLTDLLLYVLLYMPLTAALLGLFVLLRRRNAESQKPAETSKGAP